MIFGAARLRLIADAVPISSYKVFSQTTQSGCSIGPGKNAAVHPLLEVPVSRPQWGSGKGDPF